MDAGDLRLLDELERRLSERIGATEIAVSEFGDGSAIIQEMRELLSEMYALRDSASMAVDDAISDAGSAAEAAADVEAAADALADAVESAAEDIVETAEDIIDAGESAVEDVGGEAGDVITDALNAEIPSELLPSESSDVPPARRSIKSRRIFGE